MSLDDTSTSGRTTTDVKDDVLRLALDALIEAQTELDSPYTSESPVERKVQAAILTLRTALAQYERNPMTEAQNESDQKIADSLRGSALGREITAGVDHWLEDNPQEKRDLSIGLMLAGAACLAEQLSLFLKNSGDAFDPKDRLYDAWLGGYFTHREAVLEELTRLIGREAMDFLREDGTDEGVLRTEPSGDEGGAGGGGQDSSASQPGDS